MINQEVARIFDEIADIMELKEVKWKPSAYRKAARAIRSLSDGLGDIYKKGGVNALKDISGVGESLAKKIVEFIKKGRIKEFEKLKKKVPAGFEEIVNIPGMGPKKAQKLYKKLKTKSIADLKKAAQKGRIRKIEGFGEKSEKEILEGIGLVSKARKRQLLGTILPVARELRQDLKEIKEVNKVEIAGSLRRMKETVRDIDLLVVSSKPKKVMDAFTSMDSVKKVLAKGPSKSTVRLKQGFNSDLRIIGSKNFGSALLYFTGSKDHNIACRKIAIKKGYKLSEYGLFKKKKFVCGKSEKEVYKKLGLQFIPPELRENTGEIEAAKEKKLPKLINYGDIKGDLQMHSKWSDGSDSMEEMVKACQKRDYKYMALTDHSVSERIAHGMSVKRAKKYLKELSKLQKKYKSIHILKGIEVDILPGGKLDYSNNFLKNFDVVAAAVHSRFKSSKKVMTNRVLSALSNEQVTYLAHPTGRLINKRHAYALDMDKVFKSARDNKVWLEINSLPERLDLSDANVKDAVENKVKLVVNTDSHSQENLKFMELGVAVARRGWAQKSSVVNALPWSRFKKMLR